MADDIVTVSVQPLPVRDEAAYPFDPGQLSDAQAFGASYPKYDILTTVAAWTGALQCPVGGAAGTASSITRLYAIRAKKTVRWRARRLGAQPVLPHWDTGSSNEVLLTWKVCIRNPVLMADARNYLYCASGRYTYALYEPIPDEDPLPIGVAPYTRAVVEDHYFPGTLFDTSILRYSAGPTPSIDPLP